MGHRRVGFLPKTRRWHQIVEALGTFSDDQETLGDIVASTLDAVRTRFKHVDTDPAVKGSFESLVTLCMAMSVDDPGQYLAAAGYRYPSKASPLSLARILTERLGTREGSAEYRALAVGATCDALVNWHKRATKNTPSMFSDGAGPYADWRALSTGGGFCELARLYFSSFTERHLKYFLEREASRVLSSIEQRDAFESRLSDYMSDISKHAFETAKITQSFAAGWFNKQRRSTSVSSEAIHSFLTLAFGKLRDELMREAGSSWR